MSVRDNLRVYMRRYIKAHYRKAMDEIINFLGGQCVRCGSEKNLQLDHIDRKTKKFNISTGVRRYSRAVVWKEVKKCQLLCKSCHRKKGVEAGDILETKHGSITMYSRYKCRCELCRKATSDYLKNYRRKVKA